jgi:hypothetical protein
MPIFAALRSFIPAEAARFSRTGGAAAAVLAVVLLVAGALALAPREHPAAPPSPLAAQNVQFDERLAPQADPKRVPDANSVAAQAAAAGEAAQPAPAPIITLTGCLERSDEAFRLKDASGDNAPKARSWKTAFLTRKAATIQVIDGANTRLPEHVGQRVSLTGQLVNREMKVRSLHPVSASCSKA